MNSFPNGSTIQPIFNVNSIKSRRSKYHTFFCNKCKSTHYMLWVDSILINGDWYCKKSVSK